MSIFYVEFRDGVEWAGMAKDGADAASSACGYWRWQHGDGVVPTFQVFTLEIGDELD